MLRTLRQAIGVGLALIACGAPPTPAAAPAPAAPEPPDLSLDPSEAEPPPPASERGPVQAGAYQLRMTASCPSKERTAKGRLTLKRISAADLTGASSADGEGGDLLLWGQTDLDVESLEACSNATPRGSAKHEPIHPSVLVEVLQWNGQSQRQVLLVSADPKAAKGRRASAGSGGGVAMWVEQSSQGHLAGVWCRWEVMNEGEGRWEADLVRAETK